MNATLQLLFPTPVLIVDIPEIPKEDHDFLLNAEYSTSSNDQGLFDKTKNTYILKDRNTVLTKWISEQLNLFATSMMACTTPLKITQSWCLKHQNRTQQVFSHAHPNSIVSGAYYVEAPEGSANLRFNRPVPTSQPYIKWETPEDLLQEQPWNWTWHEIPAKTGRLILFPSQMPHSVEGHQLNTNTRCVLSFNTWFDGAIGDDEKLTALGF
jgi:uncharacterized protein (TIGR02466 family)